MSPGPPGESARLTLMLWRDGIRLGLGADGGHDEACCQNGPCREVFESLSSHLKGKVNQIQEYTAGR